MTAPQAKASPQEIERRLKALEQQRQIAKQARSSLPKLCEFVLRSERTNKPLALHDGHLELMELITATETKVFGDKTLVLPKHPRVVVVASPRTGKTTLITYGNFLHRLGNDPLRYRGLIGSAKKTNAIRHSLKVRGFVESSERLKMVFPELMQGDKWTEEEWTVARTGFPPKEPSCATAGEDLREQGFRMQDHYFDDMVDPVNSASRYLCEKQAEMIMDTESRVEANGQRFFIQNCFRRWDTGHILAEKFGWHLHLMPAIDAMDRTLYPVIWPQEDCDKYAPARKDQDLRCIPKREGDSEFQEAWIHKAFDAGRGLTLEHAVDYESIRERGGYIVTGVDLASRKGKKSDETALVTALVAPPEFFGLPSMRGERVLFKRLLWVEHKKMFAPEIKDAIVRHSERYNSVFVCEDVSAQQYIHQMMAVEHPDIPIMPFTTTASTKNHPELGLSGMASEFSMGMWILPSRMDATGVLRIEDATEYLVNQLRLYDPESHLGDCAAAMWFVHVGARKFGFQHQVGFGGDAITKEELYSLGYSEHEISEAMPEVMGKKAMREAIKELDMDIDPEDELASESATETPKQSRDVHVKPKPPKKPKTREEMMVESQQRQFAAQIKSLTQPGLMDGVEEDDIEECKRRFGF